MAGAYLVPVSADRAAGRAALVLGKDFSPPTKSHLPHPAAACGFSEVGNAHGKPPFKELTLQPPGPGPCPWCSQIRELWGQHGAPGPLRYLGWCWVESTCSTMGRKHLLQAGTLGDT